MRYLLLIACWALLLVSCGKKSTNGTDPEPENIPGAAVDKAPLAATLTFPAENAVCTTGSSVDAAHTSVTFTWKAAFYASRYDIVVKNLITNDTVKLSTAETKIAVTLNVATPYLWYLISRSDLNNGLGRAMVRKFYNSGPGVTSYVPFPAELTYPSHGMVVSAPTTDLTWTGSIASGGQIVNYDVYLGTTATNLQLYRSKVTDGFVKSVPVTANSTYYWKVVTRDISGNTSHSLVSIFSVN